MKKEIINTIVTAGAASPAKISIDDFKFGGPPDEVAEMRAHKKAAGEACDIINNGRMDDTMACNIHGQQTETIKTQWGAGGKLIDLCPKCWSKAHVILMAMADAGVIHVGIK